MKQVLIAISVFIAIFIVYFIIVRHSYPDLISRAQFGDLFGGLNTLFSGLAFGGVVYAILLQRKDLELQREELKLTRQELKRTAKAQEKAEEALSRQAVSLKVTAKLNGKSAILQHYNALIEASNSAKYGIDHTQFNTNKQLANEVISEINELIKDK